MDLLIMLIGPALLWAVYHYYKDRHKPEPFYILILMFALGVGAGFVSNLGYVLLEQQGLVADVEQLAVNDRLQLLFYSVVVIGGLEELAKFLPFYPVAIRHAHFNERLDSRAIRLFHLFRGGGLSRGTAGDSGAHLDMAHGPVQTGQGRCLVGPLAWVRCVDA